MNRTERERIVLGPGSDDCGTCGRPLAVRQFYRRGESCPVTFVTHAAARSGELTMRAVRHWAEAISPGFIGPPVV